MNVLSIGNSFSQDAQRYISEIAKADGKDVTTFNLFIGGCPLSLHYKNMLGDEKAYILEMNGESTNFKVSVKEARLNRNWDAVTIQQVSHLSPYYETYQPYLDKLAQYIRLCVPGTKLLIHQTWAYENGSSRLNDELKYDDHTHMFRDVKAAYEKAAKAVDADFIIPSGEVLQKVIASGIDKVHRDTFHLTYGLGRYAVGLLWYAKLTGADVYENSFSDFDEEISDREIEIAKKCVAEICNAK